MPTRPDPLFPLEFFPAERSLGFRLSEIDNPDPEQRRRTPHVWALVCPIDAANRVVKKLTENGEVVYQHRRCAPLPEGSQDIPAWRNVFLPFLDAATAVRVATINRMALEPGEGERHGGALGDVI